MFGYARIFRSRWSALLWAAGILWFAYDTAESQPHGDGNSAKKITEILLKEAL